MTIYYIPTSERGLKDNIFESHPESRHEGGNSAMDTEGRWREACDKRGIALHTYDLWRKELAAPDDILLVQNNPNETLFWRSFYYIKSKLQKRRNYLLERRQFFRENYKYFPRRVLLQTETPIVMPYAYKGFDRLVKQGVFHRVFLVSREPKGYDFFNFFLCGTGGIASSYFNDPKEKFLVLMNANKIQHSFSNRELFSERLRAIKYFSQFPDFDLFGPGWDKPPKNPLFWHYKKYALRSWRGMVENKMKTVSQYKFMICYENSAYPGYVSEKIFDCMAAGVVPVYLGAPDIETIVPKTCFIDKRDFKTYDALYAHLKSLTEHDLEAYRKHMFAFIQDRPESHLQSFIDKIIRD
ncbi:MAG: glycosyltransferase family 10 [bacterium]|nr:glycosyltransferase family 10 [bacterium]